MKKFIASVLFLFFALVSGGQIVVDSAIVPQYMQGNSPTGSNRTPFWFWARISGLTPSATYHYYTAMDTAVGSVGAGNPYLVNITTGTFRRTTNPSMSNSAGYDSLTADANGKAEGWFGVEATGNGRFTAGNDSLYPKILLNNGAGGTGIATRLLFTGFPVTVIHYGTTAGDSLSGSALYDSLNATPENFICLFDNTLANGRPVSVAVVEDDGMSLQVSTTVAFYKTNVDMLPQHWGTIIPDSLWTGIRALQERSLVSASAVALTTDADGIWCSGVNTVNMSGGTSAQYLNSTFSLSDSASIPDTTWTGYTTTFSAGSNSGNATYSWDFGDSNTGSGTAVTDIYNSPGIYQVQVIISTGGCSDTITQNVVVELSTFLPSAPSLWFFTAPNPTSGNVVLTTRDGNEKTVTVFNVTGQVIFSKQTESNTIHLDLTGQPKGMYVVHVRDNVTNHDGTRRIIVE